MLRTLLRSKIHRATVAGSGLGYVGSLRLSPELLKAADIGAHQLVQVVDINNGARFDTYAIAGSPGVGEVTANGSAAPLVQRSGKISTLTYALLTEGGLYGHRPQVVHADGQHLVTRPAK